MSENDLSKRNRASGWKHAKLSGHQNEDNVTKMALESEELQKRILHIAHKDKCSIVGILHGGLNEKDVPCNLGGLTKSKSDLMIMLNDGSTIGISVKKSLSGQVYLIGAERFINGYEKQFNQTIPNNVKEAIYLYWGNSEKTIDVVEKYSDKNKKYEIRKHRVVADTLQKYSNDAYECLLKWFNDNVANLFDYCFSKGLASNENDWANLIWYKNDINEIDIDVLINIEDAKKCLLSEATYGTRTGGSTIQLPFGFVQWHSPTKKIPGDMQFHHNYEKIVSSIKDYCTAYNIPYNESNPTDFFGDDE